MKRHVAKELESHGRGVVGGPLFVHCVKPQPVGRAINLPTTRSPLGLRIPCDLSEFEPQEVAALFHGWQLTAILTARTL